MEETDMPDTFDFAEEEELLEGADDGESDEEADAEDDASVDEEAFVRPPMIAMRPAAKPFGLARYAGLLAPGEDPAMRGVRAAVIRTKEGREAVIRMPTAVATARGVRRLGRRSIRAQAILARHEQAFRAIVRAERRQAYFTLGSIGLQHCRDVTAEVRARVYGGPVAGRTPVARYLPGVEYGISAAQTALAVAAIPPSKRSWLLSTLPLTSSMLSAAGREWARLAVWPGAGKPWAPDILVNGLIPLVVGGVSSIMVRPRQPRRYIRL
jgi:hypothetical protein